MIKLNKLFKNQLVQIGVYSSLINLILLFLLDGIFDIGSFIVYIIISIVLGWSLSALNIKITKKQVLLFYFGFGVAISLVYNIGGLFLGLFNSGTFNNMLIPALFMAALEQGIITLIVGKVVR